MTQYKCEGCKHHHSEPASDVCFHKENYLGKCSQYMVHTDAGYDCPLNLAQEDYISIKDAEAKEQIRQDRLDKMAEAKHKG